MRLLRPKEYRNSVYEVDLDQLKSRGFKAIVMDLDNTLVGWNDPNPTTKLLDWIEKLKAAGFKACIVSNNRGKRVTEFAEKLDVAFVPNAIKPRRRGFRAAMAKLGVSPSETVVIGDQLFTDILGGNRAGAYTILVVPLNQSREFVGTRIMRLVERRVLSYMNRKGLLTSK